MIVNGTKDPVGTALGGAHAATRSYFCIPLSTDRIAVQLPLASKKLLAMYYYENLPISGIAACFNLPAWRIYEILRQTVGLLGNDLLKVISRKRK